LYCCRIPYYHALFQDSELSDASVAVEGKIEGKIEVTGRRGRRRKQLLDGFKSKRGYLKLEGEALDRAVWRTCFGRGCGPVVGESGKCMNEV